MRIFLVLFLSVACLVGAKAANVAVVDVNGKFSDLNKIIELVTALGHEGSSITPEKLQNEKELDAIDCIILSQRNGTLTKQGYLALLKFVENGGTLLIADCAGYWMSTPDAQKKRHRIAGEGPIKQLTGVKILNPTQHPIVEFKVIVKNSITKGIPKTFKPQTIPSYDPADKSTARWMGVLELKATTAEILMRVKAGLESVKTYDFLTLNKYKKGRCVWIGCRLTPIILQAKERNLAKLLNNILNSSKRR